MTSQAYWRAALKISRVLRMYSTFVGLQEYNLARNQGITNDTYKALKPEDDPKKEVEVNSKMFERVVVALNRLSPKLQFVVYPGGTKV